ncbi:MAG TPA: AI-2E family transporter [Candidatus Sulfomarinibacteraceae bacterium]|nr:AI-2E family transporter [Candidatus Sulfomarinibacteraceae bacterium]
MAIQTPSHASPWTFWRVVWVTLVLLAVGVSFWLLYRFHQVLFILFIAIIIGTVLRPPVSWLQRRGIPGVAGVILVYLLLLALLIGFALLLVPVIVEQTTTIAAGVPDSYQSLRDWIVGHPNPLITQLSRFLPVTLSLLDPGQSTGQELLDTAGQALGYLGSASKGVFTGAAILLLAFYWTLDGPRTIRSLLLLAPISQRERVRELITAMETKVGAYVAGQSLLSLIIGLLALIAYLIIGLPYALVLALVAGVMEAVPLVGPLLGAIPAALVALTLGPDKLGWVVVATVVIQQIENSLLVPRVMRKAVGVNPFVSLLALFAFSSLLGIVGALMAIPMAAIIQILLNRFVFEREALKPELSSGRDRSSRLRYEAQNLARDLRHQARRTRAGSDLTIRQTDLVMDEIETLATDLDILLAETNGTGVA